METFGYILAVAMSFMIGYFIGCVRTAMINEDYRDVILDNMSFVFTVEQEKEDGPYYAYNMSKMFITQSDSIDKLTINVKKKFPGFANYVSLVSGNGKNEIVQLELDE